MSDIVNHQGLKAILRLDAVTCAAVAVLQLGGHQPLSIWLGLSVPLLLGSAVFLLLYVALLLSMARASQLNAWLLHLVVWGNVAWGVGCLALAFGMTRITELGMAYLLIQAITVAVIAAWQVRAGRRGGVRGTATVHA